VVTWRGNLARADVGDVLGGLRRPQASSIGKRRENFASAFLPDLALMPAQRSEVFAPMQSSAWYPRAHPGAIVPKRQAYASALRLVA
jgi:hypothetical protein